MSIGTLYCSHSTARGQAKFESMPFHDANITYNRNKASSMTFKSTRKLEEADRIIYRDKTNNKTFGGQITKRSKTLGGDYSYDVIDYKRLYQSKVSCGFEQSTSSQILKKLLKSNKNNLSTAGIQNTSYVHAYLKWDKTSIWNIVEQLAWLEYKAGNYIYYDVDYRGGLIWKKIPQKTTGYRFTEAYDYQDSHDSSDIITEGIFVNSNKLKENVSAHANSTMIAKWGYVTDIESCTPPSSNKTNNQTCTTQKVTTSDSGKFWSKCGLSPDKKLICAIGKPSAPGENKWSYKNLYKTVFQNKCPYCGSNKLGWGYMWKGNFPCSKAHNNGTDGRYEGHIYCDGCDMDFGVINGREHRNGSKYALKTVVKPVLSSQSEVNKLKNGKLPYDQGKVTTKKVCKKSVTSNKSSNTSNKSLRNDKNIKKYKIPYSVWKKALELTDARNTEYKNARLIFQWMDDHLPWEDYSGTRYGAAGTLKRGRGNCCDHAHLFAAMCRSIGIKCNYIRNYCIGHVYNKVYIKGKGVIVDTGRDLASWGSHYGGAGCPVEQTSINF